MRVFESSELSEVILPDSEIKIETDALTWSEQVNRIVIPSSVTYIEYDSILKGYFGFNGEIVIEQGPYAYKFFTECPRMMSHIIWQCVKNAKVWGEHR